MLTQVHSRFAFDNRVEEEFRRWQRYQRPLSFAIWDVDNFKSINDSYGQKAGDRALYKLAQLVRLHIRESDFLARTDGDEFVILVPGLIVEQATEIMEKIRSSVESAGFNYRGQRVPITISYGVTEFREHDEPDSVYQRADQALNQAKSGKSNAA